MFTRYDNPVRQIASAAAAVALVAMTGATLDRAHLLAAPYGTVEVGELTPVNLEKLAQVTLPEVVVTAHRPAGRAPSFAARVKASGGMSAVAKARAGH